MAKRADGGQGSLQAQQQTAAHKVKKFREFLKQKYPDIDAKKTDNVLGNSRNSRPTLQSIKDLGISEEDAQKVFYLKNDAADKLELWKKEQAKRKEERGGCAGIDPKTGRIDGKGWIGIYTPKDEISSKYIKKFKGWAIEKKISFTPPNIEEAKIELSHKGGKYDSDSENYWKKDKCFWEEVPEELKPSITDDYDAYIMNLLLDIFVTANKIV
jgi:hypothetical protein